MRSILRAGAPAHLDISAEDDPLYVRAAGRTLAVLSAFHHVDGPQSLSEIAKRAGIDRSAAQRIVHTLTVSGYLRRGSGNRGYLPSLRLLDHTLDVLRLDPVVQRATPVLLELRKTVRERVDLSLFDDTRLIYALRLQSKRETFYATLVGHSVPIFCTAGGRAVLAALSNERVSDLLQRSELTAYTPHTITDPDAIIEQVRDARRNGFATVRGEFLQGEVAVGVCILGRDGQPLGAIHVGGSLAEWSPEAFVEKVAPLCIEASQAISNSL